VEWEDAIHGCQALLPCRDTGREPGRRRSWFEFDGEVDLSQIERYGERWFTSRKSYHPELGPGLVDLPLSDIDLGSEHEIDAEEFEQAWREACAGEA